MEYPEFNTALKKVCFHFQHPIFGSEVSAVTTTDRDYGVRLDGNTGVTVSIFLIDSLFGKTSQTLILHYEQLCNYFIVYYDCNNSRNKVTQSIPNIQNLLQISLMEEKLLGPDRNLEKEGAKHTQFKAKMAPGRRDEGQLSCLLKLLISSLLIFLVDMKFEVYRLRTRKLMTT